MVPPAPDRAKDFSLVKRDGWYHVFYIRRDTSVPSDSTERDLGHAISRDFYQWTQLPPVLQVRPEHWDNEKVWAPDIHEVDGVYYMIYTGVTNEPGVWAFHQRIGLATSTDLMTWNRLDEPVFSCSQVRWTHCDPLDFTGGDFRDASVIRDPQGSGWIMYYTARPASDPSTFVAGTALSDGDLTQWVSGEPLWVTHASEIGSFKVESPHVFARDSLYYLAWTGGPDQPLRLATSLDPVGPLGSWNYRGSIGAMLGANTAEWFASEYFRDGTHEYFGFVNYDRVDIREIVWQPDWQFMLHQPALFHVQSLTWSRAEASPGEMVQLTIEAVNTIGQSIQLEGFAIGADGEWIPVPIEELGFPTAIPMSGPTTVVDWVARGWADPDNPEAPVDIVVRLKDLTAQSPPIRVNAASPWNEWWNPGMGDGGRRVPREMVAYSRGRSPVEFRPLARSPVGRTALLVNLREPGPARVDLFDLNGRRVRALADRDLPAGATVIPWDGRDDSGALARRGVYFARLTAGGRDQTVRLLYAP